MGGTQTLQQMVKDCVEQYVTDEPAPELDCLTKMLSNLKSSIHTKGLAPILGDDSALIQKLNELEQKFLTSKQEPGVDGGVLFLSELAFPSFGLEGWSDNEKDYFHQIQNAVYNAIEPIIKETSDDSLAAKKPSSRQVIEFKVIKKMHALGMSDTARREMLVALDAVFSKLKPETIDEIALAENDSSAENYSSDVQAATEGAKKYAKFSPKIFASHICENDPSFSNLKKYMELLGLSISAPSASDDDNIFVNSLIFELDKISWSEPCIKDGKLNRVLFLTKISDALCKVEEKIKSDDDKQLLSYNSTCEAQSDLVRPQDRFAMFFKQGLALIQVNKMKEMLNESLSSSPQPRRGSTSSPKA